MSEIKAMRLAQAAAFYNVSMDHLVEELKKKRDLLVVNNPTYQDRRRSRHPCWTKHSIRIRPIKAQAV